MGAEKVGQNWIDRVENRHTSMKSMKVWQILTMHILHCFSAGKKSNS